jgi:hypothetical protein
MCAECKVALVERLEEEPEETTSEPPLLRAVYTLQDESNDLELADALGAARNMLDSAVEEALGETSLAVDEDGEEDEPVFYHAYQNSAAKAEDNRSSASALLLIGGVGFILDLLVFTNVIPIYHNSNTSKYLVCGVMGAMFVLFIVFGIVSMRSSKILFKQAEAEDSLKSEMTKWCEENLSVQAVDAGLFEGEELEEEQKYFKRAEKMKGLISDKFLNLDEAFLEHFVDEYYQILYGEA